jgi:hypothetical protein
MRDGCLNYCKVCVRTRARDRHRTKITDREWRRRERERGRKKFKAARAAGKIQRAAAFKRAAHTAVGNAVRDGRLVPAKSCEDCGHDFTELRREAHHEDYTKPLEVRWLCALCHGKRHRIAA